MKAIFAFAALLAATPASAQDVRLDTARATLARDVLTLTTGRVTRTFAWNGGHLIGTTLADEATGARWALAGDAPDVAIPGVDAGPTGPGRLSVRRVAADAITPAHLVATVRAQLGAVTLTRDCTLFPGSPAIRCAVSVAGAPPAAFARPASTTGSAMIEDAAGGARAAGFVTDRLALPGAHWRAESVRFATATDHNDTLVHHDAALLYREDRRIAGNLLKLIPRFGAGQMFLLKEAPPGADQLGWPGHDWLARIGDVRAAGSGFEAGDAAAGEVSAYAVVVGVAAPGETALRLTLRQHMETVRRYDPARDAMLLANSWGDRSRDARMNADFVIAEIDAAARLGLTHFQLDDGWQAGLSRNSASRAGQRWEDWHAGDWLPHPQRFPNGLEPVVAHARAKGIRLGLWFNPSQANDYAAWARDADILIDYWRRYGIAVFKIDGVNVATKAAERNLTAFFDRVEQATGGAVVFNVDVTAGRRPGYFFLNRYGNIFVENRYTDWGNYYPYRSLRNLWMLAAYVPPQWLQIEFLNVARNADRYAADDPLAPATIGQTGAFAAVWGAQPLAWMETSALPPVAAAKLAHDVAAFNSLKAEIQRGRVLPIGAEPDGAAWTGFQSIAHDGRSGVLILYREALAPGTARIATLLPSGRRAVLTQLAGDPIVARFADDRSPLLAVSMARPGFAVLRYRLDP